MSFKKDHFEKVARVLREAESNDDGMVSKDELVLSFTRMFSKESHSFIAHRFVDACLKK
jgi:hypothetical protein